MTQFKKLHTVNDFIFLYVIRNLSPLMLACIEGHVDIVDMLLYRPDVLVNLKVTQFSLSAKYTYLYLFRNE